MNETYPLPNLFKFAFLFDRLCACKFANSRLASFTLFIHYFTLYFFSILSHTFTLFNRFCVYLCRLYAIYFVVILHHFPAFFILRFYDFSVAGFLPIPIR